ncbi:hypothetical protein DTO96_100844 [Ephemeroptericola cinctiostellae]|uniref:Uncharacterized protein n=1 Tax=Ephemeroptericola cinctiostellae TaxID=2268024 RepID=A0A345D9T7_9BURK|nr:hypothetical protein DTO96_100844 [Ephemeroptericola cinctiostellae]
MLLCVFAVSGLLMKGMWFTWFICGLVFRRRCQYDVAKSLETVVCAIRAGLSVRGCSEDSSVSFSNNNSPILGAVVILAETVCRVWVECWMFLNVCPMHGFETAAVRVPQALVDTHRV